MKLANQVLAPVRVHHLKRARETHNRQPLPVESMRARRRHTRASKPVPIINCGARSCSLVVVHSMKAQRVLMTVLPCVLCTTLLSCSHNYRNWVLTRTNKIRTKTKLCRRVITQ